MLRPRNNARNLTPQEIAYNMNGITTQDTKTAFGNGTGLGGRSSDFMLSCKKCSHGNKVTVEFPDATFTFMRNGFTMLGAITAPQGTPTLQSVNSPLRLFMSRRSSFPVRAPV